MKKIEKYLIKEKGSKGIRNERNCEVKQENGE
jgi:hypothetical protein